MQLKRLPPDDPREWLNRARSNLIRAKTDAPGIYLEDLCFDAQQAAEKALISPTLSVGGMERCVSILLNHLDSKVFDISLVTIFDREPFFPIPSDVPWHVLEKTPISNIPSIMPYRLLGILLIGGGVFLLTS